MSTERRTYHTGSHWGLFSAEVADGAIVGVKPFGKDSQPSQIIEAVPEAVHGESRIMRPMVRKGWLERGWKSDRKGRGVEPFVPVSWDEAIDLVAAELQRIKGQHGNEAIYPSSGWGSAGCFHNAQAQLVRFLNCIGGAVGQVTNYSFGAAMVIVPRIVGTMDPVAGSMTTWPTIADHTKLMVLFGGMSPKNAQVSMGGVGSHDIGDWLNKVKAAGVDFVSISPMRSDASEEIGAQWLPIRPNTDASLMLGLMHTLVAEELHDQGFLEDYCVGFDRFRSYLMGETDGVAKSADWASQITEIDADSIRQLARRMATERTLISVSWSIQRGDHGEQPYWMAITLAAMLGQIGLPGGGFGFGYDASNGMGGPRLPIAQPSLPRGKNTVEAYIPVARFADMMLNPGEPFDFNGPKLTYPDIRLVYWCGGNPFHKIQDLNHLLNAWEKPETIIIHDPWWTASARRADIVLPCATTLERNDIGASARDRYWFAMQQAIEPIGESRTEYDIYTALADRLGVKEAFTDGRSEMDWLRHMYEVAQQQPAMVEVEMPGFDEFWQAGHFEFPLPQEPPVLFEVFRADPQGSPLNTPSGKIEIFSETIDGFGYDDCAGHPTWMEPSEWLGSEKANIYPLHLVSNQPRSRLHSQLDCGPVSGASKISGREPVWINPVDAADRGVQEGDVVRLFNDRGACLAGVVVTDAIMPGVVQLSAGAWFDPLDPGQIGSLEKHGNPNILTIDKGTSKLAQSSTALVQLERFDGAVPAITAFDPPAVVANENDIPRSTDVDQR